MVLCGLSVSLGPASSSSSHLVLEFRERGWHASQSAGMISQGLQEDRMRFNLFNSQKTDFWLNLDPPKPPSAPSIPCRRHGWVCIPVVLPGPAPALGSGSFSEHPGCWRSCPTLTPQWDPGCSLHLSQFESRFVSIPAEIPGSGQRGGAAMSAGTQSAARGLQPGGAEQQPGLPQAGQHHQSLRGHGEPGTGGGWESSWLSPCLSFPIRLPRAVAEGMARMV